MSGPGSTLMKGRRQNGGKSRTGCRTCKIRHVKCDEQRPSCLRCSATGRACEYPRQAVAHDASSSPLSVGLTAARSERDMRGFDYFRYNASLSLMGFDHKSEFWSRMVPQLSETSPAVLRAVLALSALHEHAYNVDETRAVCSNNVVFLRQYNKSIRQLCTRQTTQPVQFTLTCCVLFICLENLGGNHETALLHLENGLALLREWHAEDVKSASEKQDREILTVVFRRLDMQATIFLNSRPPELVTTSIGQLLESNLPSSPVFGSVSEAQLALESIEIRSFYAETILKSSALYPSRKKLMAGLKARYAEWKVAFDLFSNQASPAMSTKDLQLSLLLALHYQATSLMLEVNEKFDEHATPDETIEFRRSKNAEFLQLNELCKSLISTSPSKPAFSADTGIIAPLYFIAMNAGDSSTRQQAIDLLHTIKAKEGFWNAGTAAGIAEKVLLSQRAGIPGGDRSGGIPELAEAFCVVCS